ncbi:carbohydrate kinase family protein [Candidatus Saccharibacteria bacterium]|nr:carbohydrate kinase family protein [Candidatus Saccharibacteria bacterium]
MAEQRLDVLAVGDVVTDAFIKLLNDEARVEKNDDGPRLSMAYATKVPFDHAEVVPAVGNASNASVAFAKLGLKSGLVSNIGDDDWGRDILRSLHKAKVDKRFVHINHNKKSNYHYVLWYRDDRTILIKHEEYEYHWPRFRTNDIPEWIYFSSVSQNALDYHDDIVQWLEAHPDVKLAFQPGTFQLEAGVDRLRKIYARSEILAVNREEAEKVVGSRHEDIHHLLDKLHELGPRIVLVSDGHNGAHACDGINRYKMPIYPDPKPPYDRTGAGDAFTSTFVAAVIKGADIAGALLWAPVNAMSVVQKVGAQAGLLSEREIEHFLRIAPENYHPEKLR